MNDYSKFEDLALEYFTKNVLMQLEGLAIMLNYIYLEDTQTRELLLKEVDKLFEYIIALNINLPYYLAENYCQILKREGIINDEEMEENENE